MTKPTEGDPLNVNARLYNQIGRLLDDLESADRDEMMTMPQRISALIAVGRILTIFQTLRRGVDDGSSGSAVRKYAAAFARPDAARWGKNRARPSIIGGFDSESGDDGDDAA